MAGRVRAAQYQTSCPCQRPSALLSSVLFCPVLSCPVLDARGSRTRGRRRATPARRQRVQHAPAPAPARPQPVHNAHTGAAPPPRLAGAAHACRRGACGRGILAPRSGCSAPWLSSRGSQIPRRPPAGSAPACAERKNYRCARVPAWHAASAASPPHPCTVGACPGHDARCKCRPACMATGAVP